MRSVGLDWLMARAAGSPAVKVAIIDGPVDTGHPDFDGRPWLGPADGGGACAMNTSLACGHGTFVAGLLAAGREAAAPGICPGCGFLLRPIFCEAQDFGQCPAVTTEDLANALLEVIGQGAQVVNLSLGLKDDGSFFAAPLRRVYDHARERGVLIVGAAGNQGVSRANALFGHPWIIPVAAAGPDGRPIEASNVDPAGLLAPGSDVAGLKAGGGGTTMSGTSVAAPFVTGTLALLKTLFPQATADELRAAVLGARGPGAAQAGPPPWLDARKAYQHLLDLYPTQTRGRGTMEFQRLAHDSNPAGGMAQTLPRQHEIIPQACGCGGADPRRCTCTGNKLAPMGQGGGYVYALGSIRPEFTDEGLRKEFEFAARSIGKSEQDHYGVFGYKDPGGGAQRFFYIAEQMVWVMSIGETDTYVLRPRSNFELAELVEAIKPNAASVENNLSIAIGPLGPLSSPAESGGLQLPTVLCNQLFHGFTLADVAQKLANSSDLEIESIRQVMQAIELKPNAGDTDDRRAMNYIAFRYPDVYKKTQELLKAAGTRMGTSNSGGNYSLLNIKTEAQAGGGGRRLVNVIFNYQQNDTGMQRSLYTQVDVTGQFPFVSSAFRDYIASP